MRPSNACAYDDLDSMCETASDGQPYSSASCSTYSRSVASPSAGRRAHARAIDAPAPTPSAKLNPSRAASREGRPGVDPNERATTRHRGGTPFENPRALRRRIGARVPRVGCGIKTTASLDGCRRGCRFRRGPRLFLLRGVELCLLILDRLN